MASSKQKTFKSWTMATPIRKSDNIISSKVVERGEKGFIPSYEKDPDINMNFIMSNEYWRIWFKERESYERDFYFKEQTRREESKIKRRFVQRNNAVKKVEKTVPVISLKRFANAKARIDAKRESKSKEDEKPVLEEKGEGEAE